MWRFEISLYEKDSPRRLRTVLSSGSTWKLLGVGLSKHSMRMGIPGQTTATPSSDFGAKTVDAQIKA